jgi:hypothetical protein
MSARVGRDSFAFGEKLLNLLDESAFSTTYKYALLLALIDVCMERTGSQGQAPEAISTRELAEKTLEIYCCGEFQDTPCDLAHEQGALANPCPKCGYIFLMMPETSSSTAVFKDQPKDT